MNRYTPGPWHVEMRDYNHSIVEGAEVEYDGEGQPICPCSHITERECNSNECGHGLIALVGGKKPKREGMANARLIAAAPELLGALKQLTKQAYLTMAGGYGDLLDVADAAITKAEGR